LKYEGQKSNWEREDKMKRRMSFLILTIVILAFAQPQTIPSQATNAAPRHAPNTRPFRPAVEATPAAISGEHPSEISWWQEECAECFKQVTNRALWMDENGLPHIYYGCEKLHSAKFDGVEWVLGMDDRLAQLGICITPVIDQFGYPHLVYFDAPPNSLKYAYETNSGWYFQTVVQSEYEITNFSLALDNDNNPHISYFDESANAGLMYAVRKDSSWQIETVDPIWGRENAITVDQEGRPHLVFTALLNVSYAYLDHTGWKSEKVASCTSVDMSGECRLPSVVLDQAGGIHVGFIYDYSDGKYRTSIPTYATKNLTGWKTRAIEHPPTGKRIDNLSIAVDSSGSPHFSYFIPGFQKKLSYAYLENDNWVIYNLDSNATGNPTLAIAGDGIVHISYNAEVLGADTQLLELKYASGIRNNWEFETIDQGSYAVGEYASLALDDADNAHISYYDVQNQDLKYAKRGENGWIVERVDGESDVGLYTSLALDADQNPHISYSERFWCQDIGIYKCGSSLKYAFLDSGDWQVQTLESYKSNGSYPTFVTSLALDLDGYPHFGYIDRYKLNYAYLDASGWHSQTVITEPGEIFGLSLALDGESVPYISYAATKSIRVANMEDDHWIIETVDTNPFTDDWQSESGTSIIIADDGFPHLSYSARIGEDWPPVYELRYAALDDTGWQIQTIRSGFSDFLAVSLALDEVGNPHISYSSNNKSNTSDFLYYTFRDAAGWHFQTVVHQLLVNPGPSLALDIDGIPHIAYTALNDLIYTYSMGDFNTTYLPLVER
jgi:hypothetical protein